MSRNNSTIRAPSARSSACLLVVGAKEQRPCQVNNCLLDSSFNNRKQNPTTPPPSLRKKQEKITRQKNISSNKITTARICLEKTRLHLSPPLQQKTPATFYVVSLPYRSGVIPPYEKAPTAEFISIVLHIVSWAKKAKANVCVCFPSMIQISAHQFTHCHVITEPESASTNIPPLLPPESPTIHLSGFFTSPRPSEVCP